MFRFVTKKEYWDIEDSGLLSGLARPTIWHLKTIQDAVAFSYLHTLRGQHIAEVGGGNSRLLPRLAKYNTCYNIEPFEGVGAGPKQNNLPPEIIHYPIYLGSPESQITDKLFDALFSISVVEHIALNKLDSFIADNARVLKSGALSIHLIDISCAETPLPNNSRWFGLLKESFWDKFDPLSDEVCELNDLKFQSSFATNPDHTMRDWSKIAPNANFDSVQVCTVILAGRAK